MAYRSMGWRTMTRSVVSETLIHGSGEDDRLGRVGRRQRGDTHCSMSMSGEELSRSSVVCRCLSEP